MNIKEFAKITGYSTATVSRAFGSKGSTISKKTKELLLKKAHELNYHPNYLAQKLKGKGTNQIGIFY
tara:strand:+ start:228 stop:428 length:201 start_codon:yes stop_codon:yes gene_type:complete